MTLTGATVNNINNVLTDFFVWINTSLLPNRDYGNKSILIHRSPFPVLTFGSGSFYQKIGYNILVALQQHPQRMH